jgi:FixJ family two-component response regulator
VVTDVAMQTVSGRQMADRLRRSRPGIRVPYLSGYPEDTAVGHGVLDAGVDFLPKPFRRDVLVPRCAGS